MKTKILGVLILGFVSAVWAQGPGSGEAALQQGVAELKASVVANQEQLMKYQWLQTTQVIVKGETKKEEQAQCRYGPDGKLQETPVGAPAQPQSVPKGPMGKVVAKKMAEMQDYMDRLKSLMSHYAPPDPQKIQAAMQAGTANLNMTRGTATLTLQNYYKAGDQVVFAFDVATKRLASFNVNTYLDDPEKDVVTMTNQFASLPDGTNHVQQTVVNATAKQIQIRTTNSGYSLVAQPTAGQLYRSF